MDVFLARQPIFDRSGDTVAYELLYRRTAESRYADGDDANRMSLDVVVQSFLEVGIERITQGKTGFINFGKTMLVEGSYELLDPSKIVVELLETVKVDESVREACRQLAAKGYRLALDDFAEGGPHEELVPHAEILKIDVLGRDLDELGKVIEPYLERGVTLLAEKVETEEVHKRCRDLGFALFQGYFYSRPELVVNQGASVEQTSMIALLNLLGDESASDQEIEEAFRRDASLSYKLLRMLSTAAQGGRGIESIRFAIRLLGRGTLQRWLSLLLASSFAGRGGTNDELVSTAVVRGRFCELLGRRSDASANADTLFLVGLFSLMDAILRTPMPDLLERVDLADPVRDALLKREGPYALPLRVCEAYEGGDWDQVASMAPDLGLSGLAIPDIYLDSVAWAREQLLRHAAADEES